MANTIVGIEEERLESKSTLGMSDYVRVVGANGVSYKQELDDVSNKVITEYTDVPLAGNNQSVKDAINGLDNDKVDNSTLESSVSTINNRIDNIITSPAPTEEEIIDARLGADGVTYPSLGDAIRDQVSDVKSALNAGVAVCNMTEAVADNYGRNVTFIAYNPTETGKFCSGNVGGNISYTSLAGYSYQTIDLSTYIGKEIWIKDISGDSVKGVFLLDANNIITYTSASTSSNIKGLKIKVSANIAKLIINWHGGFNDVNGYYLYRLFAVAVVDETYIIQRANNSIGVYKPQTPMYSATGAYLGVMTVSAYNSDLVSYTSLAGYSYDVYRVEKGEEWKIHNKNSYGSKAYIFTDDNFVVYEYSNGTSTQEYNVEITADYSGFLILSGDYASRTAEKKEYAVTVDDIGIAIIQSKPLYNKKILYNGDSITESRMNISSLAYNGGAYPEIIKELTGCTYNNRAVGGAGLTQMVSGDSQYHVIVDDVVNMPDDADLVVFSGGINDFWRNRAIGTIDMDDYSNNYINNLDKTTLYGALESIFMQALLKWLGVPITFVITHKCDFTAERPNTQGDTFRDWHDAIIRCCHKYSIPYCDMFDYSGLNGGAIPAYSEAYLNANALGTSDGTHPNKEGYLRFYVPKLIPFFESLIKVNA
jgi:lysophospholipase L1-like esterase